MSILYSAIGDTDPIRDYRDGAMLHIIRHYKPDKAYLFLSKDMEHKEETRHLYTTAIQHVHPTCEIHLIRSGIEEVHIIDNLLPLSETFYQLTQDYPEDTFLLNLSSGTPQMKMIMSFLAIEYDKAMGIQVDSPERASNRHEHAASDTTSVEDLIETNMDEEELSERCHEPHLQYIKYHGLKQRILSLIDVYSYKEAYKIYNANRSIFSDSLGKWLGHADYRSELRYTEAMQLIKNENSPLAKEHLPDDVCRLREYLMIMELRVRTKSIQDFYVKMTPFLYELLLLYVQKRCRVDLKTFCDRRRHSYVINRSKLGNVYPNTLRELDQAYGTFRDGQDLSFNILRIFISAENLIDPQYIQKLNFLRQAEQKIRNQIAHTIEAITDEEVKSLLDGKVSFDVYHDIQDVFFAMVEEKSLTRKLIYDRINEEIRSRL